MFSGGARTLSQSRCFCRPTPGARVLVVLYPAFRADALHAGLLADTRSAGSVSLCAAELISPTREAVARRAEAPGEIISTAQRQMIYHRYYAFPSSLLDLRRGRPGPLTLILKILRVWGFSSRFARLLRPHRPPLRGAYWSSREWVKCLYKKVPPFFEGGTFFRIS